jgi:hypothetical protein
VGTVVTLESLTTPKPTPGVVAANPVQTNASDNEQSAAPTTQSVGEVSAGARAPASGSEVIIANDAGMGLAPAVRVPLPSSAKVVPLPQPVAIGADLLLTRDAGKRGDADGAVDSDGASVAPPVGAAPSGVAAGGPVADPVDVTDGNDNPAAAPPRAPTPRPNFGGSPPEGVLAYAPSADLVDRGANAIASKGNDKRATSTPKPVPARVVSWVIMRATADNNAPAMRALPDGSMVTIVKCKSWCEIVADSKRGFVPKSFLTTTGAVASSRGSDRLHNGGGSAFGNPYLKNLSLY